MIADARGQKGNAMEAACGVEFFHCSSLIADDLPSMDDAVERRGKPSVHIAFGEATALLVSYALIAEGYQAVAASAHMLLKEDRHERLDLALRKITHAVGMEGIQQGQYFDLNPKENYKSIDYVRHVHQTKTAVLFELSFALGWIFSAGGLDQLDDVIALGSHFGHIFQMVDDIDDRQEDSKLESPLNLVLATSLEYVLKEIETHYAACQELAKKTGLYETSVFELLKGLMNIARTSS
jgi:geranylgeranyl diphosphate synthase type II